MGGIVLWGCSKATKADVVPPAITGALPVNPSGESYTTVQKAWLNFVEKVKRGEQLDPTGQYVKDGTMVPAGNTSHSRPKLDAAKDTYPYLLKADGTVILLPQAKPKTLGHANNVPPILPCAGDPGCGSGGVPGVTSYFITSIGQGGPGPIVDLKVSIRGTFQGYTRLNANLNDGAGGEEIYFHFTRDGSSLLKGLEYNSPNFRFATSDPIVAIRSGTGTWHSQPRPPVYCTAIWVPDVNPNVYWNTLDLNAGAGGAYVYTFQSKDLRVGADAIVFTEVGVLSGNSNSIVPPAGWIKWPYDLNEDAGGNFIYFCYRP